MESPKKYPHQPVLLQEVLEAFSDMDLPVFIDGTVGAGGHSLAMLEAHPEINKFLGFDQDPSSLLIAQERLTLFQDKTLLIHNNFSAIPAVMDEHSIQRIDGMLLDLGVSSMQLDQKERGFSFSKEGPLDMRMNPDQLLTAKEIVNHWPEDKLGMVLREYGEEPFWRKAAKAICSVRYKKPFETTTELAAFLFPLLKKGKLHPATLAFQGLRIAVNRELDVLKVLLPVAIERLRPGGRIAVISFHSLEDRIVKEAFKEACMVNKRQHIVPTSKLLYKKPISASMSEMRKNPRARSAKLRVLEKL
ncbi:MAG: 16S rRNA (cytosine(1402)-N(4))-methyltransferase RsmH [Parachlamydiales bacterium]|nr:16S rRNA (cytosine(1402)-N(4))-methyltransferase RsmH [Parachlamydiales bacterium]